MNHQAGGRRARAPVRAREEHPGHMDLRSCTVRENHELEHLNRLKRCIGPRQAALNFECGTPGIAGV